MGRGRRGVLGGTDNLDGCEGRYDLCEGRGAYSFFDGVVWNATKSRPSLPIRSSAPSSPCRPSRPNPKPFAARTIRLTASPLPSLRRTHSRQCESARHWRQARYGSTSMLCSVPASHSGGSSSPESAESSARTASKRILRSRPSIIISRRRSNGLSDRHMQGFHLPSRRRLTMETRRRMQIQLKKCMRMTIDCKGSPQSCQTPGGSRQPFQTPYSRSDPRVQDPVSS